jgi:hypothetical protein
MVFRTGTGARRSYRAAQPEEFARVERETGDGPANLVWVAINRFGPITEKALAEIVPLDAGRLATALERLVKDDRIVPVERGGATEYSSELCVIPFESPAGWEAAVFDHYQAVVTAICTKLQRGAHANAAEDIGGSTYGFVVWEGHPYEQPVRGLLGSLRRQAAELRAQVSEYNARHGKPPDAEVRVITYIGQTVIESESGGEES